MQNTDRVKKIKSFKDLYAWQSSQTLAVNVYKQTKEFPAHEQFGLTNQLRRAAVSVPSNIAEGFGCQGTKDKVHFYTMARGSLNEVHSQLLLALDVGYDIKEFDTLEEQITTTHKIINGLIKSAGE